MSTLRVVQVVEGTNDVLYADSDQPHGRVGRCSRSDFCLLVNQSALRAEDPLAAMDWLEAVYETL